MGAIKFVLPNAYNVYLHDTPEARLFDQSERDFSHGCIRVSEPALLASYVLRNAPGEWTPETIEAAMCGTLTQHVNLTPPVRVMILYGTAIATTSRGVLFFEDIYGHDRRLETLLEQMSTR